MLGRTALVALAIVVCVSGCSADAPTRPKRSAQAASARVDVSMAADGTLTLHDRVEFVSSDGGNVGLRAPVLGSVDDVAVNGTPRSAGATEGSTGSIDVTTRAARITAAVHDGVERYSDIAVVTVPLWGIPSDAKRHDPHVTVTATIRLPAAPIDGTIHWHGRVAGTTRVQGSDVVVDGAVAMNHDSDLVVAIPAAAAAGVPATANDQRRAYFDGRQALLDRADARLRDSLRSSARSQDVAAGLYWAAVAAEAGIPLLVALALLLRGIAARRGAGAGVPATFADPPRRDPPAVVALLDANARDIGVDAVAATILWLAHTKVIDMEAGAEGRYRLRIPASAPDSTLVDALRAVATDGVVDGPPLPLDGNGPWWQQLRRETIGQAKAAGLVRRRYPSAVFVASTVMLAITTAPLWARRPIEAAVGVAVAGLLCLLPFVGGYALTAAGHRARARWEAFGRYSRDYSQIHDLDAAGVILWGPFISYSAALGFAPHAIRQLAPKGREPRPTEVRA